MGEEDESARNRGQAKVSNTEKVKRSFPIRFRVVRVFRGSLNSIVPAKPWVGAESARTDVRGYQAGGSNPPPVHGETLLYIRFGPGKSEAAVMDNLLSLLNGDLSIWGVIAMPVGVAICFGPALFMWLKAEFGAAEKDEDRR